MTEELKPCAFCGKEAVTQLNEADHGPAFFVSCPDDYCPGGQNESTPEVWNFRATPSLPVTDGVWGATIKTLKMAREQLHFQIAGNAGIAVADGNLYVREIDDAINAALAVRPEVGGAWKPMETAPRDGTEVLLLVERRAGIPGKTLVGHYMEGGHCIEDHPPIDAGWYFWSGSMFDKASKPLFWMPLPPSPRIQEATGKGEAHA